MKEKIDAIELVRSGALPWNLKALHVIAPPAKKGRFQLGLKQWLSPVLSSWNFFNFRVIFHSSDPKGNLVGELEEYGSKKESIPDFFGGTWKYDMFSEWLEGYGKGAIVSRRRSSGVRIYLALWNVGEYT